MSAKTHQKWTIETKGSLDNLIAASESTGPLIPGMVRIQVKSIGLNFSDVFSCLGLYSATPSGRFTPGLEFSGVVLESTVSGFKTGDRVFAVTRFGAYSTIIDADHRYVRHIPSSWSFQQAASFPVQAVTSYYGLITLGHLKKAESVLIHSAAGGVGLFAAEICSKFECSVIGTVGSEDKAKYLRTRYAKEVEKFGWTFIVRRGTAEFEKDLNMFLQKVRCKGFDVIFDSLLGGYFQVGYNYLNPMGRHIVLGAGSMAPSTNLHIWNIFSWLRLGYQYLTRPRVDPLEMIAQNRSVIGFNLIWLWDKQEMLQECLDSVMALSPDLIPIDREFEFNDVVNALKYFQTGKNVGKVIVNVT